MKLLGAVCILLGGCWSYFSYLIAQRRALALLWDTSEALELLKSSVRWKKIPVPQGIAQLSRRDPSGVYFKKVLEYLESNMPLQQAWCNGFSDFPGESGDAIRAMEWGGDEAQVLGALSYLSRFIRAQGEVQREELRRRQKLSAVATLCLSGMLIVILA